MTVIIHRRNGEYDKYEEITSITHTGGDGTIPFYLLFRKPKEPLAQVPASFVIRLEVV